MTLHINIAKQSKEWQDSFFYYLKEANGVPFEVRVMLDAYNHYIYAKDQFPKDLTNCTKLAAYCLVFQTYISCLTGCATYMPIRSLNRKYVTWCLLNKKSTEFWIYVDGRVKCL